MRKMMQMPSEYTHHRLEILADAFNNLGGVAGLDVIVVVQADDERLGRLGDDDAGSALDV